MANTSQRFLKKIREAKEKQLKRLDLSNDLRTNDKEKLTDIPTEVFELEWLEVLNLSHNQLTTLPETITRLSQLTSLNLSHNQLTTLPETITRLQQLTSLDLSYNRLRTLPKAISRLQQLTSLNLSGNQLRTMPEAITRLQKLTSLNLTGNELTSIPEQITHLKILTKLDFGFNKLTIIPECLIQLKNLKSLSITGYELTTLPEWIIGIKGLISLDLSGNKLSYLTEAFAQLQKLKFLDLSNNNFDEIPNSIFKLKFLKELRLENYASYYIRERKYIEYSSHNKIQEISSKILQLKSLKKLILFKNNIENLPPEIIRSEPFGSVDVEQLKNYFRQLAEAGEDYLYEVKLLIVGEGGAGKTTLAKKIEDQNYQLQEEDSTEGIEVIQWGLPMENGREFRVNIWDFGGQEIYHATHQFFLTKRSLYVLVADTRKEDTDFYYWLNVVELLSDNSPLLIIKNEKQNRHREINELQLRGQFTNLKETLSTNLATNRGLEQVLKQIKHHVKNLPHIGSPLPKTWVKVREALESDTRSYIGLDEYLNICQQNGFTQRNDKLQLSGYLHDLGVCLHFQEDSLLNKTVILKPKWGTDAVYKVLDNETVISNLGKFTKSDLAIIWYEDEYATMQDELLRLMINFKLCYEIPRSKGTYIAPQLLTENQPPYNWDETDNLILRYTYEFMPKGIITQFIVVIHELINEQKCVWKSGVVLSKDQTKAEVIEYYGKREIKIRVSGCHKRDLMTIVTHELDKIHDSYNKRLKYNKLIPCNCFTCKDSQEPHFYKLENLKNRLVRQKYDVECDISFFKANVLSLIDDVIDRSKERLFLEQLGIEANPHQSPQIPSNIYINLNQVQEQQNKISQKENNPMSTVNQYGSGDNVAGDKVMRDKIGTQINNSQNLAQAAKDIKQLLDQLSQEYSSTAMVGVKAVEEIEQKPKLKARIVNALKEAGSEALEKAVDHPAVSIVIAATKGFIDG
ncbi:MAG: COR domain-containing protein [Nostoc sp.]|uniref:COR domain-containing protein n=1 Tax=Nostoc sp. TaxID=1180 RepID=UPI002FF663CD